MAGNDARFAGRLSFFLILFAAGAVSADSARELADKVAARYGAADFPRVESISFTFNVLYQGKAKARVWTWFPKTDSVRYRGPDEKGLMLTAAYSRRNTFSMAAPQVAAIDKSFINDQYWLLFPLHLKWDKGLTLALGSYGDRLDDIKPANDKAEPAPAVPPRRTLSVRYPSAGGYTPGDMYDLVAEADGTIHSWMFHKGAADTVTMRAHWSAPVVVDGLPLSLDRPGVDGFKVWFTGVKVAGLVP